MYYTYMVRCADDTLYTGWTTDPVSYTHLISQSLDPREQKVIRLRYGLDGRAPMAQRDVAALLGISRSYVSRIEKKAVGILRGCFADELPHGL